LFQNKNKNLLIRRLLDLSIAFITKNILSLVVRINEPFFIKLFERVFFYLNQVEFLNNYLTLQNRPKQRKTISNKKLPVSQTVDAILVQGQIQHENSFTFETIKLYSNIFPFAKIILSTWCDQDLKKFHYKFPEIIVVENQIPKISGFLNFNLQHITTNSGIEMAEKLGIKRILKTRTDQRIYSSDAITFLNALVDKFPPHISLDCKGRIFFINISSLENIPYHLSDMLHFGNTEDIKRLWRMPKHKNNVSREGYLDNYQDGLSIADLIQLKETNPEICLGRNYADQLYGLENILSPAEGYSRLLREAVGIVDKDQLDFFWPKYHAHELRRSYHVENNFKLLTFAKWISNL